jgi:general secretion pathway protein G
MGTSGETAEKASSGLIMRPRNSDVAPMRTALLVALVCLSTFASAIRAGDVVNEDEQQRLEGTTAATDSAALIARAKTDLKLIATALDLYRFDNLQYPTTAQGLKALVKLPTDPAVFPTWHRGGYLGALPKDPWGHDYRYANPGTHRGQYDLYSLGPTGEINKVIGIWGTPAN